MPRKKREIEVTCSFCGSKTTIFTVTAAKLIFCHIGGAIGVPPTKDCLTEYLKRKEVENVRQKQLQAQQEIKLKEEEEKRKKEKIKSFSSINQKLEEFHDIVGTPKSKRSYL